MSKFTKRKTALIIGRWQPWHEGHRGLFLAALERAERVAIGVRHTHATDGKNPFTFDEVKEFIDKDLSNQYAGKYDVQTGANNIAAAWEKLTDQIGRKKQLALYRASLGL